jgi:hypothetical protein
MPLVKQPKKMISWPPRNATNAHRVRDGENWWSLRDRYGLKDVWDLIAFNFQTYDPKEVNWYLDKKVGCKLTTGDGKNYRFSSAASPGFIYIPPPAFKPDGALGDKPDGGDQPAPVDDKVPDPNAPLSAEDQETKTSVLNALVAALSYDLSFTLPICNYVFKTSNLRAVYNVIKADQIKVRFRPKLGNSAKYRWDDQLCLGFTTTTNPYNYALILHECFHALLDMEDADIMDKHSEAGAYILQQYFTISRVDINRQVPPNFDWLILEHLDTLEKKIAKLPGPYIPPLGPVNHSIQTHTHAWFVAMSLYRHREEPSRATIPMHLYLQLLSTVAANPKYKKHADQLAETDGISPK